jgi:lipid-A-disaccharide synthase
VSKRIFISVGEVSGDNHAAGLVRGLLKRDAQLIIEGIGGPRMKQAGAVIHHETTRQAAMSFHAVKRINELRRLRRWLAARYASDHRPDLHICVDSSGFNLSFAALARSFNIPVLYYVAPQLWASREGRIKKMRACVDELACIFPFEEQWFNQRGLKTTFVGHPLFDELPPDRFNHPHAPLIDRPPVIGVVPGSRNSEVRENFPPLIKVMRLIADAFPGTEFVIPTTPAGHEKVQSLLAAQSQKTPKITVMQNAFDELICKCDLVLCKSGTSTVHVAAWGVPMVVMYRVNTLVWHAAGRWIIKSPKIAMVNILAGNIELVPEFVPWNGNPGVIADSALSLLRDPAKLEKMRRDLINLIRPLDQRGASDNVAAIALRMLEKQPQTGADERGKEK